LLDEVLSAFVANTFLEFVSKIAPPREKSQFDLPDIAERNSRLYSCIRIACNTTFFGAALVFLLAGNVYLLWRVGLFFGLPFLLVTACVAILGLLKGFRRSREFLRYYELRSKTHLWLILVGHLVPAALGFVSLIGALLAP
jgi:hypothetical protein